MKESTLSERTCSEPDCDRPVNARGWCNSHYHKRYRAGEIQTELPLTPRHSLSDIDEEGRTALCAICGPVDIRLRTGPRGRAECMVRRREEQRRRVRNYDPSTRKPQTYTAEQRRRWKYKLAAAQVSDLMLERSGKCHICGESDATAIDHDHSCCPTGGSCGECVRGALCHRCNVGLGWFMDSPDRMRSAADYIERWSDR